MVHPDPLTQEIQEHVFPLFSANTEYRNRVMLHFARQRLVHRLQKVLWRKKARAYWELHQDAMHGRCTSEEFVERMDVIAAPQTATEFYRDIQLCLGFSWGRLFNDIVEVYEAEYGPIYKSPAPRAGAIHPSSD